MSGTVEEDKKSEDSQLKCIMCKKVLESPRLLPCLHSICTNCLQATLDSNRSQGEFACHKCNDTIPVPVDEIEGFQINVYLAGELEVHIAHNSKDKQCEICSLRTKKNLATSMCINCGDLLCDGCGTAHSSTRLTIAHKVTRLDEIVKGLHDPAIRKMNRIPCFIHDNESLSKYCDNCDILACRECQLTSHFNHNCNEVDDVDMSRHADLMLGVQHLETKLKALSEIEKGVEETLTEIDKQENDTVEEVEKISQNLHCQIDQEKADVIDRVKRQMDAQRTMCKEHREVVSKRSQHVRDSVTFCKEVSEKGKNEEVLYLEGTMVNRLQFLDHQPNVKQEVTCQFPEVRLKNIFGSVENIRFFDFLPGPPSSIPLLTQEDPADANTPRIAHLQLVRKINTFTANDDTAPKITGLAVDSGDRLLVSDNGNRKIKRFMATGKYLEIVQKCKSLSIAVSDDVIATSDHFSLSLISSETTRKSRLEGNSSSFPITSYEGIHFAVANIRSSDFCIYDRNGEVLRTLPIPRKIRKVRSRNINFIASNSRGELIVSDWGTNSILLVDMDGRVLQEFRGQGSPSREWLPGDVCVDIHDNIFVADHQKGSILVLSPTFRVIYKHSTKREYLERPMHLCFDSSGQLIVSGKSGVVNVYSCKYI